MQQATWQQGSIRVSELREMPSDVGSTDLLIFMPLSVGLFVTTEVRQLSSALMIATPESFIARY
jgi:hypothetical protein